MRGSGTKADAPCPPRANTVRYPGLRVLRRTPAHAFLNTLLVAAPPVRASNDPAKGAGTRETWNKRTSFELSHRPTRTTTRLRQPVHLRTKPYFQRPAPLQGANGPAAPTTPVVEVRMLKTRIKRLADRGDHAVQRLAEIEASITSLSNEDLLDLADIFKTEPRPPIGDMAFVEMERRNISL